MKRFSRRLVCVLLLTMSLSCATERWSFCLSRQVYSQPIDLGSEPRSGSTEEGLAMLAVLLAPLAIDVALLPITGVRDLLVVD